jgi:transcriptional regulator with XRE-family HTH domain
MSQCDTDVNTDFSMDVKTTFYQRIMSFKSPDETPEDFARSLNISTTTLTRWAQGARPTEPTRYLALAEILGCSAAWLYAGRESIKPEIEGKEEEHGNDKHTESSSVEPDDDEVCGDA